MHKGYLKPFQFFLNKPLQIPNIPLSIGGNLYLKSLESIAATAYCLDNFESSLKRSNRLLFRYQNNLLLIQATSSAILKQKCPSKWNFTSQLANGPIKNSLQDCDEIRAFLPGKKNTLLIEQYLLLDDDKKTNARYTLYHINNSKKSLIFGVTEPLRGYNSEHNLLQAFLCEQGAAEIKSYTEIYKQGIFLTREKCSNFITILE